jgi:hypothetical protein
MGFLKRLFGGRQGAGSPAQEPVVCPRLEHLSGYYGPEYWCDLGTQRVKIASLISSYRDIGPDHVERYCKGRYKDCPVYRGTVSG